MFEEKQAVLVFTDTLYVTENNWHGKKHKGRVFYLALRTCVLAEFRHSPLQNSKGQILS